jgi:hypothetical protein
MTATARKPIATPQTPLDVPLRPLRIASLPPKRMRTPADQKLVERVRREFNDLRGLSPTIAQARRLFHLAEEECLEIFAQLLHERFLMLGADDRYRLTPNARSSR